MNKLKTDYLKLIWHMHFSPLSFHLCKKIFSPIKD